MKPHKVRDEFEPFYIELPQADYLNDLNDIPIQDEHLDDTSASGGLSDEQVSKLADDSLKSPDGDTESFSPEQGLFPDDNESS